MEETEFKEPRSETNGFHSPEIRTSPKTQSPSGYTSLKDILQSPSSSSSAAAAAAMLSSSPAGAASWEAIPIKNPLVKHAAMAYLQPLSNQTTSFGSSKGLVARIADECCDCRCVSWLCDAVSTAAREVFGYGRLTYDDDDDEDEDDDNDVDIDEDDEKVDSQGLNLRMFS